MNVDISTVVYDDKKSGESISKNQYGILQNLVMAFTQFGENKINVDAAVAVNKHTEFLVCGPTRVGKSTLIKALTGCNVPTSASLNSDTKFAMGYRYRDEEVIFWDTKGFETWNKCVLNDFWREHFTDKRILPSFCLFCVGNGAHADLNLIRYMFESYLFHYEIPVCWVITKAGGTDIDQLRTYINEGIELVGKITAVVQETIAWKTEKGYIVRVNSIDTKLAIPGCVPITIKQFGINTLMYVLATNISYSSRKHLMKLYKENEGYLSYFAAGLFESAYKIGIPVLKFLDENKRELFIKASGKPIPFELSNDFAKVLVENASDILSLFRRDNHFKFLK